MEISHPHFPKVARMILVKIRAVMMLSTRHAASTRMLAMLSDAAVAGGYVSATVRRFEVSFLCGGKNFGQGPRKVNPVGQTGSERREIRRETWEYKLFAGFCQARRHVFVNGSAWFCFWDWGYD